MQSEVVFTAVSGGAVLSYCPTTEDKNSEECAKFRCLVLAHRELRIKFLNEIKHY